MTLYSEVVSIIFIFTTYIKQILVINNQNIHFLSAFQKYLYKKGPINKFVFEFKKYLF